MSRKWVCFTSSRWLFPLLSLSQPANDNRAEGVEGEFIEMGGYAYYKNESEPGKLTVHLDGVPVDAPYWVLALGDEDGVG